MPSAYNTVTRHKASTGTRWHFAFVLCCHSNETRAPITNLPNGAQLRSTPYYSPKLHPGLCSSVGMWQWTDRHTETHTGRDTDTQTRMTNIHFVSSTTDGKCHEKTLHQSPVRPVQVGVQVQKICTQCDSSTWWDLSASSQVVWAATVNNGWLTVVIIIFIHCVPKKWSQNRNHNNYEKSYQN